MPSFELGSHTGIRARVAGRMLAGVALAAAVPLLTAGAAAAHPILNPVGAAPGTQVQARVEVKSELKGVRTTRFELIVPVEQFPQLKVTAVTPLPPGWKLETRTVTFPKPQTIDGKTIGKAVGSLIWSVEKKDGGLATDQVGFFRINMSLPESPVTLPFRGVQNYSDGSMTRWYDLSYGPDIVTQHPAAGFVVTNDVASLATVDPKAVHSGHGAAVASPSAAAATPAASGAPSAQPQAAAASDSSKLPGSDFADDVSTRNLLIGSGALILALILAIVLARSLRRDPDSTR